MKITEVKATRYSSLTEGYTAEIVIVEVATDTGLGGLGFASGTSGTSSLVADVVERFFGPLLIGQDALLTETLWQRLYNHAIPRRGGDGLVRVCLSAVGPTHGRRRTAGGLDSSVMECWSVSQNAQRP